MRAVHGDDFTDLLADGLETLIVERGTHDQLIAADGRYRTLYEYQARI